MAISHLLEDFSLHRLPIGSAPISEDALEDARLSAFEKGYQAGWDDASAAHATEQSHISAELSQNLQSINCTYREAYSHVITSLQPLLCQLVETVLPRIAQETLGQRIIGETLRMAREHAEPQLQLILSPDSRAQVEAMLLNDLPIPVRIEDDDSLGAGQVFLKLGREERRIDLDSLLAGIRTAMTGFLNATGGLEADG